MAPPACESGSQEVEESDARGSKKRSSGGQISPPGGPISRPGGSQNELLETSWGVLGSRSASGELWAGKGELENCMGGSWERLGALLARLELASDRFPLPGRGPRRPPEVIFEGFLGRPGREANKEHLKT